MRTKYETTFTIVNPNRNTCLPAPICLQLHDVKNNLHIEIYNTYSLRKKIISKSITLKFYMPNIPNLIP